MRLQTPCIVFYTVMSLTLRLILTFSDLHYPEQLMFLQESLLSAFSLLAAINCSDLKLY